MRSELSGKPREPRKDEWPPPPPPPSATEETRATKKVKHREEAPLSDYRDRLIAGTGVEVTMEEIATGDGVTIVPGDIEIDRTGTIPAVTLSTGLKEKLAQNMQFSVVVNLLGRSIGYKSLCLKLNQLWNMNAAKVVDMGCGYFLVQFAAKEDYLEATLEGPWMVLGSYLQVQTWTSAFRVHHCSPQTTAVWIRVSELPLHLYPSNVISAIGGAVGTVIRVDYNTSDLQRGKFARIAVNVDLTKPLVSKFTIDGEEFKVEYENLNELCIFCGMYGHLDVNCIRKPKDRDERELNQGSGMGTEVPKDTYGPWMIVEKRKRQLRRNNENSGKENNMLVGGSRFNILQGANLEHEDDRDENLALVTMPLAARDTNVGQGQWTFRKNKGKQVVNGANKPGQARGESLKNSKPAKSTIGDFIEYKQRQQKEELVTKQLSTLDPSSHTVMRGDMCVSKNSRQGSTRVFEADRLDPDVEQRLTQAFGRPPDRGAREFNENVAMDLEENGNPVEGFVDELEGGHFIDERDERHPMDALERF